MNLTIGSLPVSRIRFQEKKSRKPDLGGGSFLERLERTQAQALVADVESAAVDVQHIYDQLSDEGRATLQRLKTNCSVTRGDWEVLGQELVQMGAISQGQYLTSLGVRLVPLGYYDATGNFVLYKTNPIMRQELMEIAANGGPKPKSKDEQIDPLEILDKWIEDLRAWQERQARERRTEANARGEDLKPIRDCLEDVQSVADILVGLLQC